MRYGVIRAGLPTGVARWSGSGTPILALHGFSGCGADWDGVARRLGRPVIAPDLLGHGRSVGPASAAPYGLGPTLGRLVALLDRLGLERVVVLGYSLGGRLALHLALDHPDRVDGLVLIGATPGLVDPAERAARAADDARLAAEVERDGARAFLARWQARPLIATQARASEPVRRALARWRARASAPGLAATLRALSPGVLPSRWDDLGRLPPTLLVTGAEDAKFTEVARHVVAGSRARHALVPGAGHAPHLERPAATADLFRS